MHTDRIGVGVEADQQKINGGTATEAVFNRLTEVEQALMARRCRQFVITAMGSAALMGGIERTEVVGHHLQVVLDGSTKKVAVDAVGAKPGDWVICVSSSAAREAAGSKSYPSDLTIVGIIDHWEPDLSLIHI